MENGISNIAKSHIRQIQQAMRQGKLVIFAGAGVSKSSGVPLWGELIDELKKELDLLPNESDYLKIPQLYKNVRKEKEFLERIKDILKDGMVCCNPIHDALLDLNPCHIVTTNYDDLFEQAILNRNENFFTVSKDSDLPCNRGEKLLIKMHGDFKSGNIVLTENDYLDYAQNFPLIRSYVMSIFASKVVLFVGFSFSDINLKYILREVKNCLGQGMQPVYMLSSNTENKLLLDYFDHNYIHLIELQTEALEDTLKEQSIAYQHSLFDEEEKSRILYWQLMLVGKYNEFKNDLFSLFNNYIDEYGDQLYYVGKYIKHIFPREYTPKVNLINGELELPDEYAGSLKMIFGEDEISENFRKKNEKSYLRVKAWLLGNGISSIVVRGKFSVELNDDLTTEATDDPLSMYCQMNLVKLVGQIENLSSIPLSYTRMDLLHPYLLYKVGLYKDAFDSFKRLSSEMTRKRKYILAFICKYNMHALYSVIMTRMIYPLEIERKIMDDVKGIDLVESIELLPIEGPAKIILTKLANGVYLSERYIETGNKCNELKTQREQSERGGWSLNSNVINTFYICNELMEIDDENFICNEAYGYSKKSYINIIEGLLHSVMTCDNSREFPVSKITELDGELVHLFCVYIESKDLWNVLVKTVKDKKIPINNTFKTKIVDLLNNIYEFPLGNKCPFHFSKKMISNVILNIISISLFTKDDLDLPHVYDLIVFYWKNGSMASRFSLIGDFVHRYKPSAKEAISLIKEILEDSSTYQNNCSFLINKLGKYAQKENLVLETLYSVKQIKSQNVQFIASFCRVASEDVKREIVGDLRSRVKSLCQLMEAEYFSGESIATVDLLHSLKDTISVSTDTYLYKEEFVFANMVNLYRRSTEDLKTVIDKLFSQNQCFSFFKEPLSYSSIVDVPVRWLFFLEDNQLQQILKDDQIRHKICQLCIDDPDVDEAFKKRVWNNL